MQALERVTPQSSNDAFEDALQLLKHAVAECPELGDAWYYRSLVEKRLGHDAQAKYALDKASFNGSEALQQGLNPLRSVHPREPRPIGRAGLRKCVAPSAIPVGPVKQKWALVIGIGRFADRGVPALRFTTADANGIAGALKDPIHRTLSACERSRPDR